MWPPPRTMNWCPRDHFLSFLPPVSLWQSAPAWSDSEATGSSSGFDTNCDVPALAKYNNNYSPWHPSHSKWPWEAAATVPTPVLAGNKMVVASTFSWSALSMSSGSVWRMLITKINIIVYNWRVENPNLKMVKYPKLKLHNYILQMERCEISRKCKSSAASETRVFPNWYVGMYFLWVRPL